MLAVLCIMGPHSTYGYTSTLLLALYSLLMCNNYAHVLLRTGMWLS